MTREPGRQINIYIADIAALISKGLVLAAFIGLCAQLWHWWRDAAWRPLSLRSMLEWLQGGEAYVFRGPGLKGMSEIANLALDSWYGWTFLLLAVVIFYVGGWLDK